MPVAWFAQPMTPTVVPDGGATSAQGPTETEARMLAPAQSPATPGGSSRFTYCWIPADEPGMVRLPRCCRPCRPDRNWRAVRQLLRARPGSPAGARGSRCAARDVLGMPSIHPLEERVGIEAVAAVVRVLRSLAGAGIAMTQLVLDERAVAGLGEIVLDLDADSIQCEGVDLFGRI